MKIGIIGGTGSLGSGLALRWALAGHEVFIGSRQRDKAVEAAAALQQALRERAATAGESTESTKQPGCIHGVQNDEAARAGEVVVLAVPAAADAQFLAELKSSLEGKILIDCTVALDPADITRVKEGHTATAVEMQRLLGDSVRVVTGFHTVAAAKLKDLARALDDDTFIAGDDQGAKEVALRLAQDIGLRAFDAGPLANGGTLERITALLVGLNKRYRRRGIGIKLTGI